MDPLSFASSIYITFGPCLTVILVVIIWQEQTRSSASELPRVARGGRPP